MGINLSGLINAGTQAAGNYEHAQADAGQRQIGAILQAITLQRQQKEDALKEAVANATMAKDKATAGLATARTSALGTPKPPKLTPHNFMVDGKAAVGFADDQGNLYDAQRKPVQGAVTPYSAPSQKPASEIPGTPEWEAAEIKKAQIGKQYGYHPEALPAIMAGVDQTSGAPAIFRVPKASGPAEQVTGMAPKPAAGGTGNIPAPMAAKVGQAGEMMKKAADLLPMMEGLGVSLSQSASADVAQNGIGIGHARIPGTKGLGNAMMNQTPAYSQYQAAITPFVLAAAHAVGGARISQEQIQQIRQSIELAPGDLKNPQVVQQKTKNLLDLINSIGGSLPADAIAAQEAQMDPGQLANLTQRGYRRATPRAKTGTPSGPPSAAPSTPAKPAAPTGRDYGIFGKPPGDEQ